METLSTSTINAWPAGWAMLSVAAAVTVVVALIALHVASPEFEPSWRMVSEYANGQHKWLLSVLFIAWGVAAWSLAWALSPLFSQPLGKVGLLFLALAGLGPLMAVFFDINHRLHGLATLIGVPTLPVAAILLTIAMNRRADIGAPPFWIAHLTWLSIALMAITLSMLFSALTRAGVDLSGQTRPLAELPAGVAGYVGWANRLLVFSHMLWIGMAALAVIRASGRLE